VDQQLIDHIYECSFAPEFWPGVLDELAKIAGARGGVLFAATTEVVNWTASAILREGMESFAKSDLMARSPRGGRLSGARHAGFLRECDLWTDEELAADPIYYELLWPAGLGRVAATAIPLPTGETLYLNLERDRDRGPVESAIVQQLDALRPHLARSALMSARLQLERARAASETLALIGLPALVFDNQGKVLAANHLIVNGSITPAAGIKLTAEGLSAVYTLHGHFIDDDHVVGTVVGVRNDLAKQPDGTNGPFALFKPGP
jgi:hypothetical protein